MKQIEVLLARTKKFLVPLLGGAVVLISPRAQAFEAGVINSWVNNNSGGGWDYGAKLMLRQEILHYFDVGCRTGYMWSESLDTEYIPLTLTGAIKYPFCDGRFVPFIGAQFGYHFYPDTYRNSMELTPNIGFDWRFGKRKEWSIYCEAVFTMAHVHKANDIHDEQLTDGAGGSVGFSYRF